MSEEPEEPEDLCIVIEGGAQIVNEKHHYTIIPGNGPGIPWWECSLCNNTIQSM